MSNGTNNSYESERVTVQTVAWQLLWVKGPGHVDLYDGVDMIPFDKITSFESHGVMGEGYPSKREVRGL